MGFKNKIGQRYIICQMIQNELKSFVTFLKKINISQMIVGIVISSAVADMVSTIIGEFITPITNKIKLPKMNSKLKLFGEEINLYLLMSKGINVIGSMIFAFLIYKVFGLKIELSEL